MRKRFVTNPKLLWKQQPNHNETSKKTPSVKRSPLDLNIPVCSTSDPSKLAKNKDTDIIFIATTIEYDNKFEKLCLFGRTYQGESICLCADYSIYPHYVYLQRQTPFIDDNDVNLFLERLDHLGQELNPRRYTQQSLFQDWNYINKQKPIFGYLPKDVYLDGLIKVRLRTSFGGSTLSQIVDYYNLNGFDTSANKRSHYSRSKSKKATPSSHALSKDATTATTLPPSSTPTRPMLRIFEGIDYATRVRIDYNILMGASYRIGKYTSLKMFPETKKLGKGFVSQVAPIMEDVDICLKIHWDDLVMEDKAPPLIPIVSLTYDIEAQTFLEFSYQARFPIASWRRSDYEAYFKRWLSFIEKEWQTFFKNREYNLSHAKNACVDDTLFKLWTKQEKSDLRVVKNRLKEINSYIRKVKLRINKEVKRKINQRINAINSKKRTRKTSEDTDANNNAGDNARDNADDDEDDEGEKKAAGNRRGFKSYSNRKPKSKAEFDREIQQLSLIKVILKEFMGRWMEDDNVASNAILAISIVVRKFSTPDNLKCDKKLVLYWRPDDLNREKPIIITPLSQALYEDIELVRYRTEYELICAFEKCVRFYKPDILSDFGGSHFDWPYLMARKEHLHFLNPQRHPERTLRVSLMINIPISDQSYDVWRGSSIRKVTNIHVPGRTHIDALTAARNETFGDAGEKRYNLDTLSRKYVKQPGTADPISKIDFDITGGYKRWLEGGTGLHTLLIYCFVDSMITILLLETRNKIHTGFLAASKTGNLIEEIFTHGTQKKIFSLFFFYSKHDKEYHNYLYPCPGDAPLNLHEPGLFQDETIDLCALYEAMYDAKYAHVMAGGEELTSGGKKGKNKKKILLMRNTEIEYIQNASDDEADVNNDLNLNAPDNNNNSVGSFIMGGSMSNQSINNDSDIYNLEKAEMMEQMERMTLTGKYKNYGVSNVDEATETITKSMKNMTVGNLQNGKEAQAQTKNTTSSKDDNYQNPLWKLISDMKLRATNPLLKRALNRLINDQSEENNGNDDNNDGNNTMKELRVLLLKMIEGDRTKGGHCFNTQRGAYANYIQTFDYSSLYPSIAAERCLCWTNFINSKLIRKYGIPYYDYITIVLGSNEEISAGELVDDPFLAKLYGYKTPYLKVARWAQEQDGLLHKGIMMLLESRNKAKANKAMATKKYAETLLTKHILSHAKISITRESDNNKDQDGEDMGTNSMEVDGFMEIKYSTKFDRPRFRSKFNILVTLNEESMTKFFVDMEAKKPSSAQVIETYGEVLAERVIAFITGKDQSLLRKFALDTIPEYLAKLTIEEIGLEEDLAKFNGEDFSGRYKDSLSTNNNVMDIIFSLIEGTLNQEKRKESMFENAQLSDKLLNNGTYGYTASKQGIMRMMELGMSITAYGRYLIKLVASLSEKFSPHKVCLSLEEKVGKLKVGDAAMNKIVNEDTARFISNFREYVPALKKEDLIKTFDGKNPNFSLNPYGPYGGSKKVPKVGALNMREFLDFKLTEKDLQRVKAELWNNISPTLRGFCKVIGGDTDSVFVLIPLHVFAAFSKGIQKYDLFAKCALGQPYVDFINASQTKRVDPKTGLYTRNILFQQTEKTARGAIFKKQKMYMNNDIGAGKITYTGVSPKRGDSVPFANKMYKTVATETFNIMNEQMKLTIERMPIQLDIATKRGAIYRTNKYNLPDISIISNIDIDQRNSNINDTFPLLKSPPPPLSLKPSSSPLIKNCSLALPYSHYNATQKQNKLKTIGWGKLLKNDRSKLIFKLCQKTLNDTNFDHRLIPESLVFQFTQEQKNRILHAVNKDIEMFRNGEVSLDQLSIRKVLRKKVYLNKTEQSVMAEKMASRGIQITPGTPIFYTYIAQDHNNSSSGGKGGANKGVKNFDCVEDPDVVLRDYLIVNRVILWGKMEQSLLTILSVVLGDNTSYPISHMNDSDDVVHKIKACQRAFIENQQAEISKSFMLPIRKIIENQQAPKMNKLHTESITEMDPEKYYEKRNEIIGEDIYGALNEKHLITTRVIGTTQREICRICGREFLSHTKNFEAKIKIQYEGTDENYGNNNLNNSHKHDENEDYNNGNRNLTIRVDKHVCNDCRINHTGKLEREIHKLNESIKNIKESGEKIHAICAACWKYNPFPDIRPETCRKTDCENHSARRNSELAWKMLYNRSLYINETVRTACINGVSIKKNEEENFTNVPFIEKEVAIWTQW